MTRNLRTTNRPTQYQKLSPLFAALLATFPAWSQQPAAVRESIAAASPDNASLPDLAAPSPSPVRLRPSASGLGIDSNDTTSRFSVNTETSQHVGSSVGVRGALTLTDTAALGGGAQLGGNGSELFVNLGIGIGNAQRLMFTGGQLRQKLEFAFPSGKTRAEMTQNSGGAAWRFNLGSGLFDYAEATAYTARTASRDLGAVNYTVDTATLFERWRDPRRVAGSTLDGLQGKLGLRPWKGGRASFGFGEERLRYDLLNGAESHRRATGSLGLEQAIDGNTRLKFGADAAAAQSRYTLGFDYRVGDLGTLGIDVVNIRGRDGASNDHRVQVSWTLPLGKASAASLAAAPAGLFGRGGMPQAAEAIRLPEARPGMPETPRIGTGNDGLLDQVAARPTWMPSQVVAKLDTTAGPTRLIAIDKTALPAGSSVDTTGIITTPLGVAVTGIAGVTKNGGAFANAGQFALAGNSLLTNPNLIVQPAVGVVDTYVVTANNLGGGTTLITIKVSHGSVKIDSIVVTAGALAAAPTASNVTITGTAQVGQQLTGHYTYADADGNPQGTSTFRWLRGGVAIAGATATTYTLVGADQGTTITFEVTPVATVAPTTGTPVVSSATAAVAGVGAAAAPTASNVTITGTAQVGQQLTGSYTYADANNDPQGTSTFRWLRGGVAIAGATASTYTLVTADGGNTITFEVTPVSTVAPTTGTPVVSSATATVPAYVSQGGVTWMPNNVMPPSGWATWANANAYCTGTTINGQTGWRLPTTAELSALYASGALAGQGWSFAYAWSSTPHGASDHEVVSLSDGSVNWDRDTYNFDVTCVR